MVQEESRARKVRALGYAVAQARKDWAEAFLMYKAAVKDRTVAEAKAMADVAVDTFTPYVDWDVERTILARGEEDDATEPGE